MNKERLIYRLQRKILSRTSPALTFPSPSRLPACLTSFSPWQFRLASTASLSLTLPETPLLFRLASATSLSLTLREAPSRFRLASATSLSLTLPDPSWLDLFSPSHFQIPHDWTCSLPHTSRSPTTGLVLSLTLPDPPRLDLLYSDAI